MGALSHLRVLDLSRVLAGPWAGQLLGDLGAEVIKIERPGSGDDTRAWGPPYLEGTTESAYYLAANRNKKSVAVDIAAAEGQEIVRRIAATCDIVVENFKVGGLAAYGLDYDSLHAINPRLIHCSITGFGTSGPYAARPGYDLMMQAMGGLMSITGGPNGTPGGGPQRAGVAVVDLLTGMYATAGILAAVAHRDRTGEGQHVEVALLDTVVACLANQGMNYLCSGVSPVRMGNAHPNVVPYQDFATADGAIILAVGNDGQFTRLCGVLGLGESAADPRFATNRARIANREALVALIAPCFRARTTRDWVAALENVNVPCGPINSIAEVFDDPQVRARGLRVDLEHASGGTVPSIANPLQLSATPIRYAAAPPMLGQDSEAVLGALLGLAAPEIERLAEQGVIGRCR